MIHLALKYALYATIAMLANLSAQYASFWFYSGVYDIYLAIFIGTLIGLITKYILDKKYIFYYFAKGIGDNFKKFFLYSAMGIITTLIFWGFELAFDSIFKFAEAKYLGASIGLIIGYATKYHLDKKFVFGNAAQTAAIGTN